ncbi:MAG TPA: hypothetical protein VF587_18880 [Solirubrobacteraceae bacterium]
MTARRLVPLLAVLGLALAAPSAHAVTAVNNIGSAQTITGAGPHVVSYDTDFATLESGEPTHYTSDYASSVWVKWTPTTNANVRLDNCGDNASAGTKVVVYKGPSVGATVKNVTKLGLGPSSDITYYPCESGIQTFKPTVGTTYYFVIVRSKYMPTSDPGGTLEVEQRTTKPTVTFKTATTQFGPKVKIEFSSSLNYTYLCTLDGVDHSCSASGDNGSFTQGFTTHKTHTLSVRAVNEWLVTGNAHTWTFNADGLAPDTVIDSQAPQYIGPYTALFHASETDGVSFTCELISETQPAPCASPFDVAHTQISGYHTLRVAAKDKWGNVDQTPAVQKLYVTNPPPAEVHPPVTQQSSQLPVVQQQQQPVVQPSTSTPVTTSPATPCAPAARSLTTSQRAIRRRGMKVLLSGDGRNICVVRLKLVAGRRTVAYRVKTIGPGTRLTVILKPERRVRAGLRIRLVKGA